MRRAVGILLLAIVLAGIGGTPDAWAQASPDDVLEQALGHWRAASWYMRLGDANVAAIEIDTLRDSWQAVAALPDNKRPSLYVKDPDWKATVSQIAQLSDQAAQAADADDKTTALAALGRIDDALAAARHRAGVQGFSDAVRRYRDAVDRLSGLVEFRAQRDGAPFDAKQRRAVKEAAQAAEAAARALTPVIPARWANDGKLKSLIAQNVGGITALLAQADTASGLVIAAQINVVRSNYYLLFLNYG